MNDAAGGSDQYMISGNKIGSRECGVTKCRLCD